MQLHAEHRKNKNDFGTRDNNSSAYMQILRAGAVAGLLYCLRATFENNFFYFFWWVASPPPLLYTHIYYCAAGKRTEKKLIYHRLVNPRILKALVAQCLHKVLSLDERAEEENIIYVAN